MKNGIVFGSYPADKAARKKPIEIFLGGKSHDRIPIFRTSRGFLDRANLS